MNKKVLGLLMAGVLAVTAGGFTVKASAAEVTTAKVQTLAYTNLAVPALKDGTYSIDVTLLKSGKNDTSMAQNMIKDSKLVAKNGEVKFVLGVKEVKKFGFTGHAKTLCYYDGASKLAAEVTGRDKDGNVSEFTFKMPVKGISPDKIEVTFTTDVNAFGINMDKELSADLQFDFDSIEAR